MRAILAASVLFVAAGGVLATQAEMKLPEMKKQPSVEAVLDEHIDALNNCDWNRLLAQYPEDAQINLPGGAIVKGRAAIGDLFAGFCKELEGRRPQGNSFRQGSQHDHRGHDRGAMGGDGAFPG